MLGKSFTLPSILIFIFCWCTRTSLCSLSFYDDSNSWMHTISKRELYSRHEIFHRRERDADVKNSVALKVNNLNDTHQQLIVHWVGEGSSIIICLARDSKDTKSRKLQPSYVYYSYDYGDSFENKNEFFNGPNGSLVQLDKFYIHSKYSARTVFADSTNKMIFLTDDNGKTFKSQKLTFTPNDISFLQTSPKIFLAHDKSDPVRKLYITPDFGYTWTPIQDYVKSFDWFADDGLEKKNLIVQREEPNGATIALKLTWQGLTYTKFYLDVLLTSVIDLNIKGDFIFATKNSSLNESISQSKDLFIKFKGSAFIKTTFPLDLPRKDYHIADITENRILVAVHHTETLSNLYVSDIINEKASEIRFTLSLERIFCHFPNGTWRASLISNVADVPFADLHKVEGLRGIYIASQVNNIPGNSSSINPEHLVTKISFNWGVTWGPLNISPSPTNYYNCNHTENCSLHLSQKFGFLYPTTRQIPILSSKSAPGLIIATGVYGKSLVGYMSVYLSRDAGVTWKQVLKENAYFNFGDHGGIIVAVKFNQKIKEDSNSILYSTDMGESWHQSKISDTPFRIYSLMTEPGENTTVFSLFGSPTVPQHQWVIVKADFLKVFNYNCTDADYKVWVPYNPDEKKMNCLLGRKETYKRRWPHSKCYSGINTDYPTEILLCPCDQEDYTCDNGFQWNKQTEHCIRNKSIIADPYAIPKHCQPGEYFFRTKGYKKIPGDVCEGGPREFQYDKIPCPMDDRKEFLLLAQKDKIVMFKLKDAKPEVLPISGLQNVIAVEYDTRSKCVFYADIVSDIISKWCLGSGSLPQNIVDNRLHSVEGMAYDWISKHLYFVDGVRAKIEVVRTDVGDSNRYRKTIINSTIARKPRGIALHPVAGFMFWTDWVAGAPSINRANLDGSNWTMLFGKPTVEWPNGITVDFIAERLYWVDAREDYIGSSDFFGNGFTKIIEHNPKVSHPFSVAVFKDNMYWDDWRANSIFVADKDHALSAEVIATSLPGLMDLKIFAHTIQEGENGCSRINTCSHMCFGLPNNETACGCPDDLTLVNGYNCVCPGGLEPLKNGTCLSVHNTCSSSYFSCHNGLCIPNALKCDGDDDCGDNSDEICEHNQLTCQAGTFRCNTGKCILINWKCDHDLDCPDSSDEKGCEYPTCKPNQFTCDNGRCIAAKWRCDNENDCRDGSDERNCTSPSPITCQADEIPCSGSKTLCIPENWKCDNEIDCPDGTDERNCNFTKCEGHQFLCTNKKCIFATWRCDGDNDCGDNSDEENCTNAFDIPSYATTKSPNFVCNPQSFECSDKKSCIPLAWKCDRVLDCSDSSDELGCSLDILIQPKINQSTVRPPKTKGCSSAEFTCEAEYCIPQAWICDRQRDCPDGSDEKHCDGILGCKTDGSQFRCRKTGNCIMASQICDGKRDCVDGSDEGICDSSKFIPSTPNACLGGFFKCDEFLCQPLYKTCDGRQDCVDNEDEANCSSGGLSKIYQATDLVVDKTFDNAVQVVWNVKPTFNDSESDLEYIPSIYKEGKWTNESAIDIMYYRFVNLTSYSVYNVTIYIRNKHLNKVYPPAYHLKLKTGKGVPSPPRDVSAKVLSSSYEDSKVEITWSPPIKPNGDIVAYTIYLEPPHPSRSWTVDGKEKKAVITIRLENQGDYAFTMTARNELYESGYSKSSQFNFINRGLKKVADLRADRPTENSITLSWKPDKTGFTYNITVYTNELYPSLKLVNTTEVEYTVTGLSPGVNYTFEVQVVSKNEYSSPARVKAATLGSPLPSVSNVSVSASSDGNEIFVNWDPLKDKKPSMKYVVYYDVNRELLFSGPKKQVSSTNVTLYFGEDLKPCLEYVFDAGIVLHGSYGPLTGRVAKYFTDNDIKAPVNQVQVTPDSSTQPNITVSWNASCPRVTRPVAYVVNIVETNTKESYAFSVNASRDTEFSHVFGAKYGCHYNISVASATQTLPVQWYSLDTHDIPAPTRLTVISGENVHTVFWEIDSYDNIFENSSYVFEILVAPGNTLDGPKTKIHTASKSPFNVSGLRKDQDYVFAVRVVMKDGRKSDLSSPYGIFGSVNHATPESSTNNNNNDTSGGFPWLISLLLVSLCCAGGFIYWKRKRSHLTNFKNLANSHYNTRSGSTTFSGVNGLDLDDAPDIREHFSDDEPLVIA